MRYQEMSFLGIFWNVKCHASSTRRQTEEKLLGALVKGGAPLGLIPAERFGPPSGPLTAPPSVVVRGRAPLRMRWKPPA